MAEYIDRDTLFKHYRALANIEWNKTVAPISWCDAYEEIADHIAELPAADVVPKSEAEELKKKLAETEVELMNVSLEKTNCDQMTQYILDFHFRKKVIDVFEEIEATIRKHDERPKYSLMLDLAELKKKYTEEKE